MEEGFHIVDSVLHLFSPDPSILLGSSSTMETFGMSYSRIIWSCWGQQKAGTFKYSSSGQCTVHYKDENTFRSYLIWSNSRALTFANLDIMFFYL